MTTHAPAESPALSPSPAAASGFRPLAVAATAVAFVAYFVAMHMLIASGTWPMLALGLVFLPWVVALVSAIVAADAHPSTAALRRTAGLVALVVLAILAWRFAADLASRADLLLYLENLVFMLGLAALFASSLRPGREALVTRLARTMRHGDMPPSVVRYTRIVTLAWASGFTLLALMSSALWLTQTRATWSAFVNLAIWPLVACGFVVEYVIRRRVLPDVSHIPMMAGVHAFRQHGAIDGGDPGAGPR